jgi:hypothetical protein
MSFCFNNSTTGEVMERHFRSNACITWAGIRGKWWKRRNIFELIDIDYRRKSEMRPYIDPKDLSLCVSLNETVAPHVISV